MPNYELDNLRWDPYHMRRGDEFSAFWDEQLLSGPRNILYIMGKGFDPRMCIGLKTILDIGGKGKRDCLLIEFNEGPDSPSVNLMSKVTENKAEVEELLKNRGSLQEKTVQMWSSQDINRRRTSSLNASKIINSPEEIQSYTDVIVDISALPRAIYFSLIAKLLFIIDREGAHRNLHVVILEDVDLDEEIQELGIDETASFVHGFADSSMLSEATSRIPKIWIPILGENQVVQLDKIFTHIAPQEICPVVPHPAANARRSDNLLTTYRDLVFEQWRVEPRNIIYAAEQNPFDVYRQITKSVLRYDRALKPVGGCKVAISSQSNKLISIGALLAACDLKTKLNQKIGIVHVESSGYNIDSKISSSGELFNLWIEGECYAD